MARIRSVHPGLFTDEGFMGLSVAAPLACVLLIGILCEADDQGVFAWKPLSLKAKILPATAADVEPLLALLVDHRFIAQFFVDGRCFGAVRNFLRYQRPKKPNPVHPLPESWRAWVTRGGDGSEPLPHEVSVFSEPAAVETPSSSPPDPLSALSTADPSPPLGREFPTSGEKLAQMEEGGDKGRKNSQAGFLSRDIRDARETGEANGHAHPPPADPLGVGVIPGAKIDGETGRLAVRGVYVDIAVRNCQEAAGMDVTASLPDSKLVGAWLNDGYDHDEIVAAIRRRATRKGYSKAFRLSFFDNIVRQDCHPHPADGEIR